MFTLDRDLSSASPPASFLPAFGAPPSASTAPNSSATNSTQTSSKRNYLKTWLT